MAVTPAQAFEKRQVTREDGVSVIPRPMISVAALEAGYHLPSPTIDDAVAGTKYPGQMTCEEFAAFCEAHQDSFVSARKLAKAVVVVAPSNVITRASLENIITKSSTPETALAEEEIDALFQTLDTENKGAITADDFMRALHGDEGVLCLHEQRHADSKEAAERIRKDEKARAAEEERKKREEEKAAKAKQMAEEKAKSDKDKAEGAGEKSKTEKKGEKPAEKKKKASACC